MALSQVPVPATIDLPRGVQQAEHGGRGGALSDLPPRPLLAQCVGKQRQALVSIRMLQIRELRRDGGDSALPVAHYLLAAWGCEKGGIL